MNLEAEISKFWKWADKTPDVYAQNRGSGSWETEYGNWANLNLAIDKAINELNSSYNQETAENLIQALAIDNESELTLEKIEETLNSKNRFVEQVISSIQPQAKWQVSEMLGNVMLENSTQYLLELIDDQDKYVKRRALLSLNKVDKNIAKSIATKYQDDSDDYLRVVSGKIVNEEIKH